MSQKRIEAFFYQSRAGTAPVRDWLLSMPASDRRTIGLDIATVEFGWPVGMPTCRSLGAGLWEVRSNLTDGRIGRVLFVIRSGQMVLLHGFTKKTQKTPAPDLQLAIRRKKDLEP